MCDWSAMSAEKVRTEVRGAQIKWGFVGCGEHFVSYSEMEDITSFGQGRGWSDLLSKNFWATLLRIEERSQELKQTVLLEATEAIQVTDDGS